MSRDLLQWPCQLHLLLQPLDELLQCFATVRDLVLLCFGHLGIGLALVLEACIPACETCQSTVIRSEKISLTTHQSRLVHGMARSFPATSELALCSSDSLLPHQSARLTFVRPWKTIGSFPGPSQYANVHTACADLSSKPASSLWNSFTPSALRNHFLQ